MSLLPCKAFMLIAPSAFRIGPLSIRFVADAILTHYRSHECVVNQLPLPAKPVSRCPK